MSDDNGDRSTYALRAAIRPYLESLDDRPPPGRQRRAKRRTPEQLADALTKVEKELAEGPKAIRRLVLIQEKLDLVQEQAEQEIGSTITTGLLDDFIGAAREYSDRKGITFAAWREVGVPAGILRRAGIE